jgi:hypothetical protein
MRWNGSRAERQDWARDVPWQGPTMSRTEVRVRMSAAVKSRAPLAMWGTGVEWVQDLTGLRLFAPRWTWTLARGRVMRLGCMW